MPRRDDLTAYRAKRDFAKTPEPAGQPPAADGQRFVVHKHHATADHYDLRLEHNGVLLSWAVPKGPSLDPADKRYAVETEPHPLEYFDFEGVIPEGEYGGGPMIVWDWGTWAPMSDVGEALDSGDFKFRLAGQKLGGGWMLVRMKPKPGDKKTNWLFFKERDPAASKTVDILAERPESVKSGLTIEQLAATARTPKPEPERAQKPRKIVPGRLPGAVKAPMPRTFKPQLATAVDGPPENGAAHWLHEIKFDGYRTLAQVAGGAVKLITRQGLDWTDRYGVLAHAFADLPCKEAIIDGEVVVVDRDGITHFSDLQKALSDRASERLTFYAFDLVHLDGYDLSKVPLIRRKEALRALLAPVLTANGAIHYSDHVEGDGRPLFAQATELGLEGIVSKRVDAPYVQARSTTWVKAKALRAGDFTIVGYTASVANGGLGALCLGERVDGALLYRGKVGTGFSGETLAMLLERLEPLADRTLKLARAPRDMIPVTPELVAHVHYANITTDGSIRHGVFQHLVEPKTRPAPAAPPVARKRLITDADLAGITITNPTRELFGKGGPTKLDLAVYYAQVGDFMLPHILDRPVSLTRSPTGRAEDLFFQRHPFTGMPKSIKVFTVENGDGEDKRYIAIADTKGYLALPQFGVIELHSWGSTLADVEHPDRVIFDLDPGEGIRWKDTVAAAKFCRAVLERLGLRPFVKTSGGKGIHVVVPLKPKLDFRKAHDATGRIAALIAAEAPDTFVVNMAKAKRNTRIFIDFHRNHRGSTAVAPYSLRARPGLPASMPVHWDDLDGFDGPGEFNYSTVPALLDAAGDAWTDIDAAAGDLAAAVKRLG